MALESRVGFGFKPQILEQKSADDAAAQLLDKIGLVHAGGSYVKPEKALMGESVLLPEGREGNALSKPPATGTTALATSK